MKFGQETSVFEDLCLEGIWLHGYTVRDRQSENTDLRQTHCGDGEWIQLADDSVQWRDLVNEILGSTDITFF
jgi:hypothetical protein